MFMFRRRHHRPSLCKLLLILLGFGALVRRRHRSTCDCEGSQEEREAYKAKAKQFRSKLKEAFAVWADEPAEKAAEEATDKI